MCLVHPHLPSSLVLHLPPPASGLLCELVGNLLKAKGNLLKAKGDLQGFLDAFQAYIVAQEMPRDSPMSSRTTSITGFCGSDLHAPHTRFEGLPEEQKDAAGALRRGMSQVRLEQKGGFPRSKKMRRGAKRCGWSPAREGSATPARQQSVF